MTQRAQDCQPPPGPANCPANLLRVPHQLPLPFLKSSGLFPTFTSLRRLPRQRGSPRPGGRPFHCPLLMCHLTSLLDASPLCRTEGGSHCACRADPRFFGKVMSAPSPFFILPEALGTVHQPPLLKALGPQRAVTCPDSHTRLRPCGHIFFYLSSFQTFLNQDPFLLLKINEDPKEFLLYWCLLYFIKNEKN